MTLKIIGAICILAACSTMGFSMAAAYRRQERGLQELIRAIEYMENELQYRMTALPELIKAASEQCTGVLGEVLLTIGRKLEDLEAENVSGVVAVVLDQSDKLSTVVKENIICLSQSLGKFDLAGQLSDLRSAKEFCRRDLEGVISHKEERIRIYKVLGLSAGAALVILFI